MNKYIRQYQFKLSRKEKLLVRDFNVKITKYIMAIN